jgi:hypothetical protein
LQPPLADFDPINLNDGLNLKDGLVEAQRHFVVQVFYVEQWGRKAGEPSGLFHVEQSPKYHGIPIEIPPLAANQNMITTSIVYVDTFSHFSEESVLPIVLCWRLLINWITPPKRCI